MKDDPDHGFRVCVNALINKCLKPYASTVPMATDEIKKLHATSKSTVSALIGQYRYAKKVRGSWPFTRPTVLIVGTD